MVKALVIWEQMLDPEAPDMPREVAEYFLGMKLDPSLRARFQVLADGNSANTLTKPEREEMWRIAQSNQLLSLLKMKARLSTKRYKA